MQNGFSKFTLKCALFVIPILVFCIAVHIVFIKFPMYFFDGEYAMYQQQKDYIYNNTDYNRVIILGDSKAKAAYSPLLLSDETYNLSLGGATSIENYYSLKEYLDHNEAPETIFISFAPFHYMEIDCLWTRSVYFHRISDTDIDEIYNTALLYDGSDEITENYDKLRSQYKYYSVVKYGKPFLKAFTENRYEKNSKTYRDMNNSKGQVYFGDKEYCDDLGPEQEYNDFEPLDIMDHYLRITIDMCIENDIDVIVDTLPINEATYKACKESYLQGYSDYMNKLQSDYPQIIVNTDLCYYGNEYFGDATHFNSKGTEKYSEYIKNKYSYVFE